MIPVMEIVMPQQSSGNVPAFLAKLWKIVDNPETDLLISWTDEGSSFIIKNQAAFARDLLPYYYKHSNMASFVRQLNMYGFHKVLSVDSGGLKGEKEEMEFAHLYFLRGQEHLLSEIKRKVSIGHTKPTHILPTIRNDKVLPQY
ncbi:heat shock factor protein [Eurytemora carolleeae]|uniref:heat shock factor protein n=1 Tax=Eurytemora carolleeae TaxID=1294199 RepID=UPI000C782CE3|nr:heat shock factor protein [Eurytemora carolleeae]|eukprot:XP_023327845.1 heat shock factor protein-like [Eurytemora affinis]